MCTDMSNYEQLAVCFRWVDTDLEVHEEFVGLYQIDDISAHDSRNPERLLS